MGRTKKHIILDHLAQSKGLRRKDLVTFICINNGYEGHKRGYYGTTLQQWALEGYIQKKGNKWYIGNLGKTYLKSPKQATSKSSINKMTKGRDNWKEAYHEAQHNADQYRIEYKEAMEQRDNALDSVGDWETMPHSLRQENERLKKEVEELRADKQTIAPNTLVKMPPPSTDYSEFTKAELVAIIKAML